MLNTADVNNLFDDNEGNYGSATISSTSDTIVVELTNSGSLTRQFSQAQWWPSVVARYFYPRSITVEARYDGDPGSYQTVWSTTTNSSTVWQGTPTTPSGMVSPWRITQLRFTLTNWSTTGTAYLYSIGLHHRSETPFPQYLSRSGGTIYGLLTILLQCARGEHTRLLDLTRSHHEAYATAHGMEYLCRYGYHPADRPAGWDKIALILEVLRKGAHARIIWLDADTLIADTQSDLRDALPEDKWLGMVQCDPPHFNNGVMYVRNTPQALAFFEAVWDAWPVHHPWEDNAAVIQVLGQEPGKWDGVAALGDEWNSTFGVNECQRPVVRAWHGYGTADGLRLEAMRDALAEIEQAQKLGEKERDPGSTASAPPPGAGGGRRPAPLKPKPNPVPIDPVEPVDFRERLGRPLRVRWEGGYSALSSLALVSREFCLGLLAAGDVELTLHQTPHPWQVLTEHDDPRFRTLFSRRDAPLSGPVDVTIRHEFPPDWRRPETGKLVVMQPWEYGHLPREWVEGAIQHADEVWAYSRFVRDVYVRSGVPAEKVRIVPLGFNPDVFTPNGPRASLATGKSLRFLFIGGALHRKGADLLLAAYRRAFTVRDDVCLVVKDMGTRTFYRGDTLAEEFRRAQADPWSPEILYSDADLGDHELAALYRACTCVVLPYRGEGFALPPLEGMACGLPAIVTAGGPTDDYLDDSMALRVPYYRCVSGQRNVGPFECAGDPWQLEPDLDALVDALRWVRDHPEEAREHGAAARAHVSAGWTWEHGVARGRERLAEIIAPMRSQSTVPARLWAEPPHREPQREWNADLQSMHRIAPASGRVELSLCLIARDEEARIGSCLRSIAPYVDEMIVVDTGSTDRTREVALDCGARVFEFPWVDSFAAARNASLEQARGEWIFWMDADDVISPECGEALRRLIQRHPHKDAAYQVQVRIPPGPGEFSVSAVDHIKLFPNRPDLRFEHRIHEQILSAIRQAGLQVCFSELYVTHQNYDRSEKGQALKRRRDFALLDQDLADHPDHPFVLFNLGMTHLYATRELEVAAHYLRRSLDRSYWTDSIVSKAFAMFTTARVCQGEWAAALAAVEEGLSYYPDDAELLYQAGQIYQQVGRFEEARQVLERLVSGKDNPGFRSVDVGLRTYRGWHELALLYRRMGNGPHCAAVLREILATQPDYTPARIDLVETLYSLRREEEARQAIADIRYPSLPNLP